jgi:hypothetical protein
VNKRHELTDGMFERTHFSPPGSSTADGQGSIAVDAEEVEI